MKFCECETLLCLLTTTFSLSHTIHPPIPGLDTINLHFRRFLKQCNYEFTGILNRGKYYIKLLFLNHDENR